MSTPEESKVTQAASMTEDNKPHEDVYGDIIFNETGKPFATQASARATRTKKSLDAQTWEALFVAGARTAEDPDGLDGSGYVLHRKKPEDISQKGTQPEEEYWLVQFSAKASVNDTDDVQLAVQGETLVIQREKSVVLPYRFLDCANHARYPHFRQLPNKPRKIVAWIQTYPYQKVRKATKEEFEAQKRDGTKKVRRDIERYGFDLDPDTVEDEAAHG